MLTASLSCIPVSTGPRPSSLSANSLTESRPGPFGFAVSLALPLPEFSHASAKTTGKAMKKLLIRVRLLDVITSSGSSACPCNRALSADLMEFLLITRNGLTDHLRCHLALLPSEDLDPPAFEILVDMEEVLHLLQIMLRKVGNVEVPMVVRVVARHREDLVVGLTTVEHFQDPERAAVDLAPWKRRLVDPHQHVERIPVFVKRAGNETVVARVVHGGIQHAVETDQPRPLVELVLVAAAARDLDDRRDLLRRMNAGGEIVPRVDHVVTRSIVPL